MKYYLEIETKIGTSTLVNCAGIMKIDYYFSWATPEIRINYFNDAGCTIKLKKDADKEAIKRKLEKKADEVTSQLIKEGTFFQKVQ